KYFSHLKNTIPINPLQPQVDVCRGHHLSVRSHPYQSAKSPEYQAFRRFTVRHGSRQIVDSRTP
ncbi:hypothetical protein, partial [Escherichia coli]|uniref:hypothetical protein n=1 Tax=Escherichia coli TaxID=562 RepID=UPI001BC93670